MSEPITIVSHDLPSLGISEPPEAKGYWCYAAAEAAIIKALTGRTESQAEIAHSYYMSVDLGHLDFDRSDSPKVVSYRTKIEQLKDTGIDVSTYAKVAPFLDPQDDRYLREAYGQLNPERPDLAVTGGKTITVDEVCKAIERGALVAVGDVVHWYVIYGYAIQPNGDVHLLVWDPTNGAGRTYRPSEVTDLLKSDMYYVVSRAG